MHKLEKCLILDEVDEAMYLTEIDDYSLIFMNNKLKSMLKIDDDSYIGDKCYELIHNQTMPCEFCKNFKLRKDAFESKKRYVPKFDGYYNIKCKCASFNDTDVRLVITDDITDIEHQRIEIERKIKAENAVINFINEISNNNTDSAIEGALEEITNYYKADRGYIFSIDYDNQTVTNTHEFCWKNVIPQKAILQNLPIDVCKRWFELFNSQGYIFIDSVENEVDPNSSEYAILKEQDIKRLLALPFRFGGKIIGFIGVDEPKFDYKDTSLLKTISFFIFYDESRKQMVKKLEMLSNYDTLTGLKNRNSYMQRIWSLEAKKPKSLAVIFIDLNGLKEINDKYGHDYGDERLKQSAMAIKEVFADSSYRVGGDEFVVILTNISREDFENRINKLLENVRNNDEINFSIGYTYEQKPKAVEELVKKADELMYQEKLNYYKNKKEEA